MTPKVSSTSASDAETEKGWGTHPPPHPTEAAQTLVSDIEPSDAIEAYTNLVKSAVKRKLRSCEKAYDRLGLEKARWQSLMGAKTGQTRAPDAGPG